MMTGRLNRLRRMTFDEGRWRASELVRTLGDRIRARLATPRWKREDIAGVLAPDALDAATRAAIARQDWPAVNDQLISRLANRRSRCVIDPSLADALPSEISRRWPAAVAEASARGDRILAGNYDLLGYRGLTFADWHSDPVHRRHAPRICWAEVPFLDPAVGDHKIIWERNRHQHWLQLGRAWWLTRDERYARAIVDQLESWLAENPPLTGINWSSMLEIGFRTISWTMAIHFLLAGSRQLAAGRGESALAASCQLPAASFLVAIDRQLTHVEHHLSYYFSPNTHLTGEALALYVVGQAFPELARSKRWVATGRRILLSEIERQVLPDGGHAERSTHYQRYTLDFYLLALLAARRAADVDAARTFAAVATQLAEFTRAMADDEGRLPLIGDDDGGMLWPIAGRECNDVRDSLAVAALALDRPDLARWGTPEEAFWIAAPEALNGAADLAPSAEATQTLSGPRSSTLRDTGYVVLRADSGDHVVFDTGMHGYMNGGHAHADALSMTLRLGKRTLLVDPGTSTYTMDLRLRDRMRGSFNHNTVAIDGRPQSTPAGPFHWKTTATGRLHGSRHSAGFDWVEAAHDGYSPIEHRRSIVRADGAGLLVVDELRAGHESRDSGLGTRDSVLRDVHSAAAHWHFDPGWMVRGDGDGRLRATHIEGDQAWLLFDAGDVSLLHGDEDSGLGWFAPVYGTLVPTWTARIARDARVPFSMITWIGASHGTTGPSLERLAVTADPAGEAIAARVLSGQVASTYLIRPGEAASRDSRACGLLEYQTNARVVHFRMHGDALVALDLVDASHALALRDGLLNVAASERMPDLHATLANGVLHLAASEPPRELRVEGRGSIFVITAGDWSRSPSSPLFHFGAPFALDEVRPERCEEIWPLRESSW